MEVNEKEEVTDYYINTISMAFSIILIGNIIDNTSS